MDWLISMYIDDELDLDEKIEFVEMVHQDGEYKDKSVQLLAQEKILREDVADLTPPLVVDEKQPGFFSGMRLYLGLGGGLAAAICLFIVISLMPKPLELPPNSAITVTDSHPASAVYATHRFVIYQPEAGKMEIAGSFSDWNTLPMKRAGAEGYWEVTIDLPAGEHRFTYVRDGEQRLPDPTLLTREQDDFGGDNSILNVEARA